MASVPHGCPNGIMNELGASIAPGLHKIGPLTEHDPLGYGSRELCEASNPPFKRTCSLRVRLLKISHNLTSLLGSESEKYPDRSASVIRQGRLVNGWRLRTDEPDRPLAETLESASSGKNSSRGVRRIKLEGFDPGGGNLLRCRSISLGIPMLGRAGNTASFILTSAR